jgi:L,D-peptidoglycan transpeptidase YkuD (ErfK/YbiS/YcfS/YnhG family)
MHKSGGSETVPFGLPVIVRSLSASATTGVLSYGSVVMPCALGRRGKSFRKHEGDGASPCGTWPVRYAYYRADRLRRPRTGLQLVPLQKDTGWCDASGDRHYNQPVTHPYPASAERLWRDDGLYDVVVVLGYNDAPRIHSRGSAIFLHVARPGYLPTEGCVALVRPDLIWLLGRLTANTRLMIT